MLWDSHKYLGFHLSYSIAYTDVRPRSLPILQAGSASNTQEPLPMHFVLDTICRLQCQDPRDRVYGVLSVVEWGDSEPMKPNYDLDVFDFALQFADYLRSSTGTTHNLWYILRKISQLADAMGFPHTLPPQLLATVQGHATQCVEDVTSQVGNPNVTKQYRWWGIYLLYDGDNWELQGFNGESDITIRPWTNQDMVQPTGSGLEILLPPEAQHGDWLLIE